MSGTEYTSVSGAPWTNRCFVGQTPSWMSVCVPGIFDKRHLKRRLTLPRIFIKLAGILLLDKTSYFHPKMTPIHSFVLYTVCPCRFCYIVRVYCNRYFWLFLSLLSIFSKPVTWRGSTCRDTDSSRRREGWEGDFKTRSDNREIIESSKVGTSFSHGLTVRPSWDLL